MERDNSYLIGNKHAAGNQPNVTCFKKGHTPWNKNLKGIRLSPKSEFKKGKKPLVKYSFTKYYGDWLMREARLIRRLKPCLNSNQGIREKGSYGV